MRDQKNKNEKIAHERILGLPPMQLAEKVSENRGNTIRTIKKVIVSILPKLGFTLLLSLLLAGTYVVLARIFQEPEINTEVSIVALFDAPNVTLRKNNVEINLLVKPRLNNTSVRNRRDIPKRNVTNTKDTEPIIKNAEEVAMARSAIINFVKPCDNNNKDVMCEEIVSKLNKITKRNTPPVVSPIKVGQRPITKKNNNYESKSFFDPRLDIVKTSRDVPAVKHHRVAKPPPVVSYRYSMEPNEQLGSYPQQIAPQPTTFDHTCLLARLLKDNPQHLHAIYPQIPTYIPAILDQGNQGSLLNYRDVLASSRHPKTHMVYQERIPHQQDIELTLNFLKTSTTEGPSARNSAPRDTPCPAHTRSCRDNSDCVPEKKWCDAVVDCTDASDEAQCACVSRIDTFRICDGYFDCPVGEDEVGCYGCPPTSFSCEDVSMDRRSTCFTREQRCNNIIECPNQKDEMDCNLLSPYLRDPAMFAVSNTEGFLQRNYEGTWYPVCKNSYMWAHDACRRETGLMMRPPFMQMMPVDPILKINSYINTSPQGSISFSEVCSNSSAAVYVTCPDLMCGTTVPTSPELLRGASGTESRLFGRIKRMNGRVVWLPKNMRIRRDLANHTSYFDPTLKPPVSMDARDKRTEGRVVGGKPSKPAAWPWLVAIYRDGKFHCGGVILNERWIISAAHCVSKFWNHFYEIQIGMLRRFSFSPQEYALRVSHVIVNQGYNSVNMKNDLALLRVKHSITFSRWVRPICLPSVETAGQDWIWGPHAGVMCTAVGWGATFEHGPDPDHIREVEVPIWSECKHSEDKAGKEICAAPPEGGKDACQGDSGGPLLCRNPSNPQQWYVAGIVSHGDGCAREGEPGVYTRVSIFVQWIKYHVFAAKLPSIRPKQECPGFKCVSGITRCLPLEKMCDKNVDCLGGEDEMSCHFARSTIPDNPQHSDSSRSATNSNELLTTIHTDVEDKTSNNKFHKESIKDTSDYANAGKTDAIPIVNELDPIAHYKTSGSNITDSGTTIKRKNDIESALKKADLDDLFTSKPKVDDTGRRGDILMHNYEYEKPELESSNLELGNFDRDREAGVTDDIRIFSTTSTTVHQDESGEIIFTTTMNPFVTEPTDIFDNLSDEKIDVSDGIKIDLPSQAKNTSESTLTKIEPKPKEKLLLRNGTTTNKPSLIETRVLPLENKNETAVLTPATTRHEHQTPVHFLCNRILQVVPYRFRCDHKADCEDGSDELRCTCIDYLTTFDKELICDGTIDCSDGQDEQNCFGCPNEKFLCKKSKTCLSLEYVCDGKPQCSQGEDELECYALSNGTNLLLEFDGKPKVNLEGFLTKKHANRWDILCEDDLTIEEQETTASRVCRYLGFSAANRVLVKHINVKDSHVTEIHEEDIRVKREHKNHSIISTQFSYRNNNGTNRQVITNPVILKEECVPNITRTCMALYVFCERILFNDFMTFEIDDNMLGRAASVPWPWLAKVFVEGEYKCSGVLIDVSWVLISQSCLWDNLLSHSYITVVLGAKKVLRSTHGPYEQILQVDEKKDWYTSKVTLLHLKQPAEYTAEVKPMAVSSFTVDGEKEAVCVAIGQDDANNTVTMFLQETHENCQHPTRCFIKQNQESLCSEEKASLQWAGIVSCHGPDGWHPSASFVAEAGECGVSDAITAMDIGNLRSEIKHFLGSYLANATTYLGEDACDGVRCVRGQCVTANKMCNGVMDCANGADETEEACQKKQTSCEADPHQWKCECSSDQMKCKNGRCVSKKLFGNGNDECGDGSDEPIHTSCAQYLARTAPMRLCDGVLHCKDKTDEDPMFCKCFSKKSVKCSKNSEYCVAPDMMCDGHIDCIHGEDEQKCLAITAPSDVPYGTGIVIERSYGLWKAKCYPKAQHKRTELEIICKTLGFLSGHAKQLKSLGNLRAEKIPKTKLFLNSYHELALNNVTKIHLRSSDGPLAVPMFVNEKDGPCHPLLIECI